MKFESTKFWCTAQAADHDLWTGRHSSREEAIEHGRKHYDGAGFAIQECETRDPASYFGNVLDGFKENIDETSYDPIEISAEAEAELDELLRAWAVKHVDHCFSESTGRLTEEIPAVAGWVDPDAEVIA